MKRLAAVAIIAAVSVSSAHAQQASRFYFGAYGGGAGFNADKSITNSETETQYLQGTQSGTAQDELIDRTIAAGVPIERADSLPDRPEIQCQGRSGSSCYVVSKPNRIVANVQGTDGQGVFIDLEGGIRSQTEERVEYSARAGITGGVVAGYRMGAFRIEGDFGLSAFDVRRTETRSTENSMIRPIVPDNVDPRVRKDLQGKIDDALDARQAGLENNSSESTSSSREYVPTLTSNIFADLPVSESINPYIGAGLGIGWVESEAKFAWQLQTGVNYRVSEKATISIGYRFQRIENTNFGDLSSHAGLVGIRYNY